MGMVAANKYLLGLEGAGVNRRRGSAVKLLKVGQRVMVFDKKISRMGLSRQRRGHTPCQTICLSR